MADKSNPAKTYTLDDFILEGKTDQLTYKNFAITTQTDYASFVETGLLDYYLKELRSISVEIPIENVTHDQIIRYKYQPDLLAYDIYGSVQLDFVVMLCNGIIDPKEFDFKVTSLILPQASTLMEFLSQVYRSEQNWINLRT